MRAINVRKGNAISTQGVNGLFTTDTVGRLEDFFDIHGCDSAVANISSLAEYEDGFERIDYRKGEWYRVYVERDCYIEFRRRYGIYIGNLREYLTTDDTRARFSKEQIKRAEDVARLARNLGHPCEQVLHKMLRSGNIHGRKFTARDVDNAVDIGGKSVPFLRGKSVRKITAGGESARIIATSWLATFW